MVNVNAIGNFMQIVKKATCVVPIAQYNSNDSLTASMSFVQSRLNNLYEPLTYRPRLKKAYDPNFG